MPQCPPTIDELPEPRAALLERRLTACLLAAGTLTAVSSPAQAGVVYSGLQNLTETLDSNTGQRSELYGNLIVSPGLLTPAVSLAGNNFFIGWQWDGAPGVFDGGASLLVSSPGAGVVENPGQMLVGSLFSAGDVINDGTFGKKGFQPGMEGDDRYLTFSEGQSTTAWLGATGYAGIGLSIDGREHFGWIHLSLPATVGFGSTITVIDWAYCEEPDTGIAAGQTEGICGTSVPEPSVPSLLLLGLGAAGVAGWRRRRAAARAQFAPAA